MRHTAKYYLIYPHATMKINFKKQQQQHDCKLQAKAKAKAKTTNLCFLFRHFLGQCFRFPQFVVKLSIKTSPK